MRREKGRQRAKCELLPLGSTTSSPPDSVGITSIQERRKDGGNVSVTVKTNELTSLLTVVKRSPRRRPCEHFTTKSTVLLVLLGRTRATPIREKTRKNQRLLFSKRPQGEAMLIVGQAAWL